VPKGVCGFRREGKGQGGEEDVLTNYFDLNPVSFLGGDVARI